jgi:hypothetical protein
MLKNLEGKSENKMGVRHSGPVIQARDVQAYLFLRAFQPHLFYVPFRPNFDVIQAQVFLKYKIMEILSFSFAIKRQCSGDRWVGSVRGGTKMCQKAEDGNVPDTFIEDFFYTPG